MSTWGPQNAKMRRISKVSLALQPVQTCPCALRQGWGWS